MIRNIVGAGLCWKSCALFFARASQHCLLIAPIPLCLELEFVLQVHMMNLYHRPVPNGSEELIAPWTSKGLMGLSKAALEFGNDTMDDESDAVWESFPACMYWGQSRHLSEDGRMLWHVLWYRVCVCVFEVVECSRIKSCLPWLSLEGAWYERPLRYDKKHCWHQSPNVLKNAVNHKKTIPTCRLYFSWREEIVPMLYGYETWVAQVNHATFINVCIPRWLFAHPLTVKHTRCTASKDDTILGYNIFL